MCGSEPRLRCAYNYTAATAHVLLHLGGGPMRSTLWETLSHHNIYIHKVGIGNPFRIRWKHYVLAELVIAKQRKIETVTLNVHKLEHRNCNEDVHKEKFAKPVKHNLINARWKAQTEVTITRMHSKTSSLYFPKSAADTPTDFPRRSYLFHKNEPI